MSGPSHYPLVAWSKQELQRELWDHQTAEKRLLAELNRRGERDDKRHGFPIAVYEEGVISTAFRHFPTAAEAYEAAVKYAEDTGGDVESAPYQVHPVYLGKNDPPVEQESGHA